MLRKARSAIGTPYVRGGTTPDGFDCSGFVCWTYKSVGVQLPRTAREQSVIGQRINNVDEMRAGDIVAFRHPRRGYHTGIYVGDGKFIHSPHKRTRVRINSLDDPYFKSTFLGARRIKVEGGETMIAQAESRLNDFTEERVVRELSRDKKKAGKTSARDAKRDAKRDDNRDDGRSKKKDKVVQVASNDKKSGATSRQQTSALEKSSKASGSEKSSKTSSSEKSSKSSASEKSSKASSSEKSSKASAQASSGKSSAQASSGKSSAQAGSGKSSAQATSSKGSADKDKASKSSKPSSQKAETKKSESKKSAPDKVATKAEPKSKKDQPKGKGDNS